MSDPTPPLPAFIIIGAQKGATRWFRFNLGKHPDIYTPDEELEFFNSKAYRLGLDHYRSSFDGWNGEDFVGEATPGYMILRHDPEQVAARIDESVPDVQLFAVLRDPVDRLYSAFIHHVKRGRLDPDDDIVELVERMPPEEEGMQLVAGGWYARSLVPYVERFGDRLTVVLNEEARSDPEGVYADALRKIGADDSFVPDDLSDVVFSRTPPKDTRYWSEQNGRRSLSDEERQALREYFTEDTERLEDMIGRDLSGWKS